MAAWKFRIAKIVPISKTAAMKFSNDISSQTLSPVELKLDGRHHSDTEIQNC